MRRTVDLTNNVPKSFRCSYKKQCKEAHERLTKLEQEKMARREKTMALGRKIDVHKQEMEKKPVKIVGN
jgi:hypothetical protein